MLSYRLPPGWAGPLHGKEPWPLRFYRHGFGAVRYNTLACSLIYSRRQWGTRRLGHDGEWHDHPSGPPPAHDWKKNWRGGHGIIPSDYGGRTFPGPVEIEWTSMDGQSHASKLDLDAMFSERLVLHHVSRDDVKETWLASCAFRPVTPSILVEVDDRTVNVYMRAMVATKAEQKPGNPFSCIRYDLIRAWSHIYGMNITNEQDEPIRCG